jgi:hypothetical protein
VSQRAVGIAPQAKEGRLPECPHER